MPRPVRNPKGIQTKMIFKKLVSREELQNNDRVVNMCWSINRRKKLSLKKWNQIEQNDQPEKMLFLKIF